MGKKRRLILQDYDLLDKTSLKDIKRTFATSGGTPFENQIRKKPSIRTNQIDPLMRIAEECEADGYDQDTAVRVSEQYDPEEWGRLVTTINEQKHGTTNLHMPASWRSTIF